MLEELIGQYVFVFCYMEYLSIFLISVDIKGCVKFIVKRMRDDQFVVFCYFLVDVFFIFGKFSFKM